VVVVVGSVVVVVVVEEVVVVVGSVVVVVVVVGSVVVVVVVVVVVGVVVVVEVVVVVGSVVVTVGSVGVMGIVVALPVVGLVAGLTLVEALVGLVVEPEAEVGTEVGDTVVDGDVVPRTVVVVKALMAPGPAMPPPERGECPPVTDKVTTAIAIASKTASPVHRRVRSGVKWYRSPLWTGRGGGRPIVTPGGRSSSCDSTEIGR